MEELSRQVRRANARAAKKQTGPKYPRAAQKDRTTSPAVARAISQAFRARHAGKR